MTACTESVRLAEQAGHGRSAAWSLSMIGRIQLLCGDAESALRVLNRSADGVARERWAAFSPWVESLRAEALLAVGRADEAAAPAERAYAVATTMADECWIAVSARSLALVRFRSGDRAGALEWVSESLRREPWYLWTHGRALATAVAIGAAVGDTRAPGWAAELHRLIGRAQLDTNLMPHQIPNEDGSSR
ncbi:MAG TPA: hypothetical protein VFA45_19670 [Actinomycetes bacterium]|nr:hypothetical protein [Actinomycetes bacterium]